MIKNKATKSPLNDIRTLMQDDIDALNTLISQQLYTEVPLVEDMSQYIVNSGGKRIRPIMGLIVGRSLHYQPEKHPLLAAIIEFIHTATLLHDDVIDLAEQRRGQKAANLIWGNSTAVLVGDFLYSRAFQMMVALNELTVMDVLAKTTNKISEGEVLQLMNAGDATLTEETYYKTIYYKTARLFEATTELAAILSGANEVEVETLKAFGKHFGLAYQLTDDALDYDGNSDETGKNIGQDLSEGKLTLPLIHIMNTGNAAQQQAVRQAIQAKTTDNLAEIQAAIAATNAIAHTKTAATHEVNQALSCLDKLQSTPYQKALVELTNYLVDRSQ